MLTNTAPVATNAVDGDITEISAGNGYSAGGNAVASKSAANLNRAIAVAVATIAVATALWAVQPATRHMRMVTAKLTIYERSKFFPRQPMS